MLVATTATAAAAAFKRQIPTHTIHCLNCE